MNKEFINKLTALVEANLENERFGIEELAREMGMSHSGIHRKLKEILNQNISQFIREIRLKKAKELLLNEDLTAAEIAYRVGFGSPTYFNKCFHATFGVSPGEFRNREPENEPENPAVEAKSLPKKPKRPKIFWILIVCALFLIPLSFFLISRFSGSKSADAKQKSIALLPFKYLGGEPEKQYLADGMMDAILVHLSKISNLRVISRTSMEQYRKTNKSAKTIGKELGVAYLVEGSFQKEGDRIRLILQLIKTVDDDHAWSNEYDRDWKDIFSIQSEVSETIASELKVAITPDERQLIRKAPTTNLTAYDFYQRGMDEFEKYGLDNQNDYVPLGKAQKYFRKALELDSTFALAYVQWAGVIYQRNYWKNFLKADFQDSVFLLANKALTFDNRCAEGYYYRGLTFRESGKSMEALKELDKAIQLNSNAWWAYYLRSLIFQETHDFVGSISNMNEAVMRNRGTRLPDMLRAFGYQFVDFGFIELGKKYFIDALELTGDSTEYLCCLRWLENSLGNFEKAYQLAITIYKRDPNRVSSDIAIYCSGVGHYKEAIYYFEKLKKQLGKSGEIDLYASKEIAYSLWKEGRIKEAKYYFDQQIKIGLESIKLGRWNSIQKGAHFDLAEVYAFLGDKEKAYYYLDEVNKNHSFPFWWVTLFKYHPLFNSIRQEPRFQKILKDVEEKYQAEHERLGKWLIAQGML